MQPKPITIQSIKALYQETEGVRALERCLDLGFKGTLFLKRLILSAAPVVFSALQGKATERQKIFILNDADEAGYFYHDLSRLLGQEEVLFFPSSYRRNIRYGQRDSAQEVLRCEALSRLARGEAFSLVTYPEAMAQLVERKEKIERRTIHLQVGQRENMTRLVQNMVQEGFQEVDYVYNPGQVAKRGSIVDVFSYSFERPFRIDFFGDEVDSIRTFNVATQLSDGQRESVDIVMAGGGLKERLAPVFSLFRDDAVLVMKDKTFIRSMIKKTYDEGFSKQAMDEALEGKTEMERQEIVERLTKENALISPKEFNSEAQRFAHIEFGNSPSEAAAREIEFQIQPQPLCHKDFSLLLDTLDGFITKGYRIYVLADSDKQNERLRSVLDEKIAEQSGQSGIQSLPFTPVSGTLHAGFVDEREKVCLFTDHQIFDRYHKYNLRSDAARAGKMALTLKEIQQMEVGDYVVHIDYGIGRFSGLVRVPVGEKWQEVIRITFQHGDKVDVSIHSLYKISKYRRKDSDTPPRLSTLGSSAWDKLKERTKQRIKEIARDLIHLYAKRKSQRGFAFAQDSYLQHELEASFLYEDTPDQMRATQEVKRDMESARPMDRLVCGDVGFGKTEVAIRAAFKAAADSKQTAVLVPTTVLAYQHFKTFSARLKGLPVKVDYLSRARSTKQQREILESLAQGRTDIIIGTHKLIGKAVKFHDLGLLVIDEEQKFGVSVKERLRKMKTEVDTLTMSATPIPRTLQFSLLGARDMSIMRTPPPNRYPIATEIHTFSKDVIREAVNFEMSRNGQVFFVNNRIGNLLELQRTIHEAVPDARIAIGHGQMKPEELEKVIFDFMNYEYDVLLSTTIVENGIDIANANTIIINEAHKFGLSDLHQMRGRVGRSNKKAFCYLLAPPLHLLTQEARRRLEALETFSELGSGFNLSMQDLDIRGAGNLLGREQSGFMEDLGYETYQKILSQAVTELKNDEFQDLYDQKAAQGETLQGSDFVDDCALESDLDMYFSEQYVAGSSERMLLYRELEAIETDEDLENYRKRLQDRFGDIPKEGEQLLQVVPLRRLGRLLGAEKITLKSGRMQLQLVSNKESAYYRSPAFGKIIGYASRHPQTCRMREAMGHRLLVVANIGDVGSALSVLRDM